MRRLSTAAAGREAGREAVFEEGREEDREAEREAEREEEVACFFTTKAIAQKIWYG
jgi:hypothetical protein